MIGLILAFPFLFFVLFLLLAGVLPSIGEYGEKCVAKTLTEKLPEEFTILNDITIPSDFAGTTQIDHVVLSPYGIFIIETKTYSGWISGAYNSEEWTQNIYGYKYKFRNPLKQNYAHLKALQGITSLPMHVFHLIVTFSDRATIKTQYSGVVNNRDLVSTILQYNAVLINSSDLSAIIELVSSSIIKEKDTKKNHVDNVKRKIEAKNNLINDRICPKCGGNLVERNGKYGRFYGCSNYPRCKFTHKL